MRKKLLFAAIVALVLGFAVGCFAFPGGPDPHGIQSDNWIERQTQQNNQYRQQQEQETYQRSQTPLKSYDLHGNSYTTTPGGSTTRDYYQPTSPSMDRGPDGLHDYYNDRLKRSSGR